ncbi:MAG: hypothetical protein EAX86_03235 [Candidatus Heimdallarchaeota archaeon]|nr:hypothetical protein [Candidatus Heimdallarchaeota archaeon]
MGFKMGKWKFLLISMILLLVGGSTALSTFSSNLVTSERVKETSILLSPLQGNYILPETYSPPRLVITSEPTVNAMADHTMSLRGTNDSLRFSVMFTADETAHYWMHARLYDNTESTIIIESDSWGETIIAGNTRTVIFDFCGYIINEAGFDGPYAVYLDFNMELSNGTTIHIYGDEITPYENVHWTKPYLATDFAVYPIIINSVTPNYIDTDNGLYEWVDVELDLTVNIKDDYWFDANFRFTGTGSPEDAYTRQYLTVGTHTVTLKFATWDFAQYSVSAETMMLSYLYIRHDTSPSWGVFEAWDYYTTGSTYSSSDFDTPPIVLTGRFWEDTESNWDLDGDGKFDYYKVIAEVDKLRVEDGQFRLYANLCNETGYGISGGWAEYNSDAFQLNNIEPVNVTFVFNGIDIYRNKLFNSRLLLNNLQGYYSYNTPNWDDWFSFSDTWLSPTYYNFTAFEGPTAFLTGNFYDYGLDTDGGGFDYLVVEIEVDVLEAREFGFYGDIHANDRYQYASMSYTFTSTGVQTVSLQFEAFEIYRSGIVNTPVTLYISLEQHNPYVYLQGMSVDLSNYTYSDFNPPHAQFFIPAAFSEYTFDSTDPDTTWDELKIVVPLQVNKAGYYYVYGTLRNPVTNQDRSFSSTYAYFNVGNESTITLSFPSAWFWAQHTNTSYILSYVQITETDSSGNSLRSWDTIYNAYTTSIYDSTDFDAPPAYITGNFYEWTVDKDSDGDFDFLVVAIEIETTLSGLNVELDANLQTSVYDRGTYNYTSLNYVGRHNISMFWDATQLWDTQSETENYTINFRMYDTYNWILLDQQNYITHAYSWYQWDPPGITFTGNVSENAYDADYPVDGKYDFIEISVEVQVTQAGYYNLEGSIYAYDGGDSAWFYADYQYYSVGIHWITTKAVNYAWVRNHLDGTGFYISYMYLHEQISGFETILQDYDESDHDFSRIYYHSEFDQLDAWVVSIINNFVVDTNNDSLYDYWSVVFLINVIKDGANLYFCADLESVETGNYIADAYVYLYGVPDGLLNITLNFRGSRLYNSGFSGQVRISYYYLVETTEWMELQRKYPDFILDGTYSFSDFSPSYIDLTNVWPLSGSIFLKNENTGVGFGFETSDNEDVSWITVEIWIDDVYEKSISLYSSKSHSLNYEEWGDIELTFDRGSRWELVVNVYGTEGSERTYTIIYFVIGGPVFFEFRANISAVMLGGTIKFTADVYDVDGIASVTLHIEGTEVPMAFESNSTWGEYWFVEYTFNTVGQFAVYATAEDSTGMIGMSAERTIYVNDGPEIISVTVSPDNTVDVGEEVTFVVQIRKSDAIITSVTLEVVDNKGNKYIDDFILSTQNNETLTYTAKFTPQKVGTHVCTIRALTTKNQVSSAEEILTVLGTETINVTPGFDFFVALCLLSLIPTIEKARRKKD